MKSAVLLFSLAVLLAAPPLLAQCQNHSGLTYATYQDAGGQTRELKLELLVPASASPVPVVIWIHGGGWFNGSRLPIPAGVSALCSKGYAVASIDYRLTDTAIWPAQIQDSKGAVRWLRAHAATYNLDPDRVAAWGASAGAQLASVLGTSGDEGTVTVGNFTADLEGTTGGNTGFSSRVQAVVSWYGYGDMLQMNFYPSTQNHDTNGSPESKLVGDWIQKVPERTATASPITFASPDDPPFLVMHGTLDDLVPFNQSELLVDALRRNGVRVTWVPVPNGGHGNAAFNTAASYQTVYDFLQAALLGLPAVTVRVVAADASASEAASGAGTDTATFTVLRTGSTASPLTVRWAPGGTARIGTDYSLAAPWSVVLPAGAASANLTLTPVNDLLVEGDETAVVRLANDPAYRIDDTDDSATAVLSDDDMAPGLPVVTIEAADPAASEVGLDGGSFTVSVSPSPASDLLVRYEVSGTATNGEDVAALSGVLTVPAGISSADLDVAVLSDSRLETGETVIVTLSPGRLYEIGLPSTASVRILELDDDSPMPVVSVSAVDPYASEPGNADGVFAITRTGSTASSLLVDLLVGGSAEGGSDYWNLTSAVFFGQGVSRLSVVVEPTDDNLTEGPETVTLAVGPEASILLGPYAGSVVTIADDEPSQGADGFHPLPPCRLLDTRGPAGPWGRPRLQAGEIRVFELGDRCGIPPDAIALSLNVTVVNPDSGGFVNLFETGAPRPNTYTTTFRGGQTRANNTIARLTGAPPSLAVYCGAATGGLDLILDVAGYFR
ncbi:MAG TPA: alpha/beta hydrolase fold domain-containing protein [Thermoanaerobaculia bacterium]|nr:alpha/beta hydrolase fold domain-containing protein [Thermoanaerobaculia bacterium]